MPDLKEPKREEKERFLDLLQAYLVTKGGSKIPVEELKERPLREILDMVFNNGLWLNVVDAKVVPYLDLNR